MLLKMFVCVVNVLPINKLRSRLVQKFVAITTRGPGQTYPGFDFLRLIQYLRKIYLFM